MFNKKRKNNFSHIHCIICGDSLDTSDWDEQPKKYICGLCINTFPGDYILYRLNCYKAGIYKKEFDRLETRLSYGDNVYKQKNINDNENNYYMIEF